MPFYFFTAHHLDSDVGWSKLYHHVVSFYDALEDFHLPNVAETSFSSLPLYMATPSTFLEDEGSLSGSDPLSGIENRDNSHSKSTRKRNRESFDENFDDTIWDLTDDGRPKTRRVNPQRLAIRLGPDLVAEMEAHIIPGAKMPTFAVRKDFQERYSVDRRHIYDYFHSRGKALINNSGLFWTYFLHIGLRVAKEDKHTNLIRGRALKAQAQAQAIPKVSVLIFIT